jgi:transmembrane sensor
MNMSEEHVRMSIALQAGDWFARNRAGTLDEGERRAFAAWLKASPLNAEEYLEVALIASDLPAATAEPDEPLEVLLERARNDDSGNVVAFEAPRRVAVAGSAQRRRPHRVRFAAAATLVVAAIGALLWWNGERGGSQSLVTRHGEQQDWRLADGSVLHLDTDTAVTVRYARHERSIEMSRGQALFEVAHEPGRPFRVLAGPAEVIAVGTQFDVRKESDSTLVTVVQGRVTVAATDEGSAPASAVSRRVLLVSAGQQARVTARSLPAQPSPADLDRSTAWLRRQLSFERQPLEVVAAEFNRYSPVPIEIETPALRTLPISGVFAADDIASFIGFLRNLEGVSVETSAGRIRVFRAPPPPSIKRPKEH